MEILSHQLVGLRVTRLDCPKNRVVLENPDTIVMHYTAGGDALQSALYLADSRSKVSAHLVIARDGKVFQLVPFNRVAWHAGSGKLNGRMNVNTFSIGIELANAGKLIRREGRWYTWFGREVSPGEVYTGFGKEGISYWHSYSSLQLQVAARVCRLLEERYPIREIVGHSDITSRKLDPGPAFPWENFRDMVSKAEVKPEFR